MELGEEEKRLGIEMSVWIWKRPIRTAAPIESAFFCEYSKCGDFLDRVSLDPDLKSNFKIESVGCET